ncbi:hypothetical protein R3I93_014670 [Phoxinus phoxinus]|uniref:Transmembrane protein 223 n=2 Tax=Phoxinus phoxinus TaxID=58324 RepID=A0AAN9H302_9TELE
MAIQCVLFGVKHCRTFISAYRLTRIQSFRASVSTATKFVKINDITSILSPVRSHVRVNSVRNAYTFTSTAVSKDVILFQHDRTRFFRLLALFCGGQFVFWTYLAHFAFTSLRDTRNINGESPKVRTELGGLFSFDMNLGSNAWRYGFTLGCIIIGGGIVGAAVLFSRRSVSRVILHKGGGNVTVSTQSPLGPLRAHHLTVPLTQVACHAHRQESPSFIPLKVKGYKFYFLMDKDGTLNNPKLFDITVGAYRPI